MLIADWIVVALLALLVWKEYMPKKSWKTPAVREMSEREILLKILACCAESRVILDQLLKKSTLPKGGEIKQVE